MNRALTLSSLFLLFLLALTVEDNAQTKPAPKTISGGILNGKAVSLPKPFYPADAAKSGKGGTVKVRILIDERGRVESAEAINGTEMPSLRAAAEAAARQARFTPTTLSGRPAKVSGVIVYDFAVETNEERLRFLAISTVLTIARHFAADLTQFNDLGENGDVWRDGAKEYPEFSDEFKTLMALESLPVSRRLESIEGALSSLRSKAKGADIWFFDAGVNLGDSLGTLMWAVASVGEAAFDTKRIDEEGLKLSLNKLKQLLLSAPQELPQDVLRKLHSLVALAGVSDLTSDENLPRLLSAIEELLVTVAPDLGN
jgi:TonB family protein